MLYPDLSFFVPGCGKSSPVRVEAMRDLTI